MRSFLDKLRGIWSPASDPPPVTYNNGHLPMVGDLVIDLFGWYARVIELVDNEAHLRYCRDSTEDWVAVDRLSLAGAEDARARKAV